MMCLDAIVSNKFKNIWYRAKWLMYKYTRQISKIHNTSKIKIEWIYINENLTFVLGISNFEVFFLYFYLKSIRT